MNPAVDILHDIHGLDGIPWWPLAPGWWAMIGLVMFLVLVLGARYWLYYCGLVPGWRGDARRQLRDLKKALRRDDARDVAGRLSMLLRRIAMARSERRQVAGLSGDEWLAWLAEDDATGFKWVKHGQLLLRAPYMPADTPVERREVMRLIVAAVRWVDTTAPASRKPAASRWRIPRFLRRQAAAGGSDV